MPTRTACILPVLIQRRMVIGCKPNSSAAFPLRRYFRSLLVMRLEIATAAATTTSAASTSAAAEITATAAAKVSSTSASSKVAACPTAEVSTTRGVLTLIPALLARFILAVLFAELIAHHSTGG